RGSGSRIRLRPLITMDRLDLPAKKAAARVDLRDHHVMAAERRGSVYLAHTRCRVEHANADGFRVAGRRATLKSRHGDGGAHGGQRVHGSHERSAEDGRGGRRARWIGRGDASQLRPDHSVALEERYAGNLDPYAIKRGRSRDENAPQIIIAECEVG